MIIFHNGAHPAAQAYCHGMGWNHPNFIGGEPATVTAFNTIPAIRHFLDSVTGDGETFPDLNGIDLDPESANVYVMKGFHQSGHALPYEPHLTVAWDGYLFHVNAQLIGGVMTYVDVTRGAWRAPVDMDGYQAV